MIPHTPSAEMLSLADAIAETTELQMKTQHVVNLTVNEKNAVAIYNALRLAASSPDYAAGLANIKAAIIDADPSVLTDTLWMPDNLFKGGTVVDYIDHLLSGQQCRPAPPWSGAPVPDLRGLQAWVDEQCSNLGAVDGYDYHSGEEAAYRHVAIEIGKRIRALPVPDGREEIQSDPHEHHSEDFEPSDFVANATGDDWLRDPDVKDALHRRPADSAGQEPIWQYLGTDGGWYDCDTKGDAEKLSAHGTHTIRRLYAAPPSLDREAVKKAALYQMAVNGVCQGNWASSSELEEVASDIADAILSLNTGAGQTRAAIIEKPEGSK